MSAHWKKLIEYSLSIGEKKLANYTDAAPWLNPPEKSKSLYQKIERSSFYLAMRDGVKIAIDLYLPGPLQKGTQVPAILHQTRYYRRFDYFGLFKPYLLQRDSVWREIRRFVREGYAVLNVDVRGSGASFGTRRMEFSPAEIADGAEIVTWIVRQPWSLGLVGTVGTSYTGSAAELLLTNQHPAVKAAVIRYANFDAYPDVVSPGGIRNEVFLRTWSKLNHALDRGMLPDYLRKEMGLPASLVVHGVAPVQGDKKGKILAEAISDHQQNYDIYETASQVVFRDDVTDSGLTLDQISPFSQRDAIEAAGVPIYSWSGWFDGGFTASAIKRALNIHTPGSRLILGPWDHGGEQSPDPHKTDHKSNFDHTGEVLRFFDRYLREEPNGIEHEPLVRYFTMGEGTWRSANQWPPPGLETGRLFLSSNKQLVWDSPAPIDGSDRYQVDPSTTSGVPSRWLSLVNVNKLKIGYPDRAKQDCKLLVYQSQPLKGDIELTGHPLVRLFIRTSAKDGSFFVYLEDVTIKGEVFYVTEGHLRGLQRKYALGGSSYNFPTPQHSFERKDAAPLTPGEATALVFDMLPVSYLFRHGHSIRLAIAGADADNFIQIPVEPPRLELLWGMSYPSCIELPVRYR